MRVGVLGVGRLGTLFARTLAEHPAVTGLVLAGSRPGSADTLAEELGQAAAATASDVFGKVDAVVIATSTSAHVDLILAAAEARLPIFCEKPIALDLADTDRAIAAVESAGVHMQVGFQRRLDPEYRAARQSVESGEIGDVYLVRTASHDPKPSPASFIATSGDIFRDLLIHDFDAMRYITGQEIEEVNAVGEAGFDPFLPYREHGDFGVAAGTVQMSDGAIAIFTGARHNPDGHDVRLEVLGSRGSCAVGWDERTPLRPINSRRETPAISPYRSFLDRFGAAYQAEMNAFVDLVLGESTNPCSPLEARSAFVASLAAYRSAQEGRSVAVSEM